MLFRNVSPQGDLDVPVLGVSVKFGDSVDVPDELVAGFGEQPDVWALVKKEESK